VRTPPPQLAMVRPELAAYPELDAVLQRCLAKQRELRPETAAEMARLLAELEPVLARSPASAPPRTASRPGPIHASGYVEVLRDPGSTLLPAVAMAPGLASQLTGAAAAPPPPAPDAVTGAAGGRPADGPGPTAVASDAASRRPRRRLAVWLGGTTVASVIGVALGLSVAGSGPGAAPAPAVTAATSRGTGETAPAPAAIAASAAKPPGPAGGTDSAPRAIDDPTAPEAAPGTTPAVAAAPAAGNSAPPAPGTTPAVAAGSGGSAASRPAQAAAAPGTGRPAAPTARRPATTPSASAAHRPAHTAEPADPKIAEQLREAEDAYRSHAPALRQFTAADLVLRADPGHVRARFLAGDALLRSGDIDNGCKYLARIKQLALARTRARAAGCPDD
jgi:hypothetical protein